MWKNSLRFSSEGRRHPNTSLPPLSFLGGAFRCISWNGRGICHHDRLLRKKCGEEVRRLAQSTHVICFQEVHGSEAEVLATFSRWLPRWRFSYSVCKACDGHVLTDSGGVLIGVCPQLAGRANSFAPSVLVDGRVQSLIIELDNQSLGIYNIHNSGLSRDQVDFVGNVLEQRLAHDRATPMHSFSFVAGDFNFTARSEGRYRAGRPLGETSLARPVAYGAFQHLWERSLSGWVEIGQPFPTHIAANGGTCARIDRAWVSCTSARLISIHVESNVIGTPEDFDRRGLSDHAPVACRFCTKQTNSAKAHVIPKWLCKLSDFSVVVDRYFCASRLLELDPAEQLAVQKRCILAAAREVRDMQLFRDPGNSECVRMVVDSISRAIWRQDVKLAWKVICSSSIGSQFLEICDKQVRCRDFVAFDDLYNKTKMEEHARLNFSLRNNLNNTSGANSRKRIKSKLQASRRQQALFWPSGKILRLSGLKVEVNGEETLVTHPSEVQEALRNSWGPVYAKKECDTDAAHKMLKVYLRRISPDHLVSFRGCTLPDAEDFAGTIKHARHSAAGPDGIPYAAFQATPEVSARVLANTSASMATEQRPAGLDDFNKQLVWFAPKGSFDGDKKAVFRKPQQLRTIFGSNSSSKLVASAVAYKLTPPTLAITPSIQRGFCKGRQLALNVVDLDSYMRVFNSMHSRTGTPGTSKKFQKMSKK